MKWLVTIGCLMMGSLLFSQPEGILWYDQKWPDTIAPMKMEMVTLDSLGKLYDKQNLRVGGFEFYWYMENLYLIKRKGNGFRRYKLSGTYHFNQGIFIDKAGMEDINGDGMKEMKISFHLDFTEIHYLSGNGMTDNCIAYIDTSSMEIIFALQEKFEASYIDVEYKDEKTIGLSELTEFVEVGREEGTFEVEYVLRNEKGVLEIVCNRFKKGGELYQNMKLQNPGITRYEWRKDKWIKL